MKVYVVIALITSLVFTYIIWDFYRIKSKNSIDSIGNIDHSDTQNYANSVLPAKDVRKRNDQNSDVIYDYHQKYFANYLVINLENPEKVCFKTNLNTTKVAADSVEYNVDTIAKTVELKSASLEGFKPKAAFNTAYFSKGKNTPLDFNFVQGHDYTWFRNWTSMNITRDNKISFVRAKISNLYNTAGGGPKIVSRGVYYDPCLTGGLTGSLCQELNAVTDTKEIYNLQRTIVGVTNKNKMIVVVSHFLEHQNLANVLIEIAEKEIAGKIIDANMFDGGSSSALYFDDNDNGYVEPTEVKQSGTPIVATMLVFTGKACRFR